MMPPVQGRGDKDAADDALGGSRKVRVAGLNNLTIGFASSVIGACATYYFGVRAVSKDLNPGGS